MKKLLVTAVSILCLAAPFSVLAAGDGLSFWSLATGKDPVLLRNAGGSLAGVSISAADFGTDGIDELLVGSAPGAAPTVQLRRADGSVITSFPVFDKGMTHGVNVAAGDVDGDGKADAVAGSGFGSAGHVVVTDLKGKQKGIAGGLFPFGQDASSGANVAVGDLDHDGKDEIVAAPAGNFEPRIKIYSGTGEARGDFLAFDAAKTGGVSVAVADLDGDGYAEIIAALAFGGDGTIRIFNGRTFELIREFRAFGDDFSGGLSVSAVDLNGDGESSIIAAPLTGGGPQVKVFDFGGAVRAQFFAGDAASRGGTVVAGGRLGAGKPEVVTVPAGIDPAKAALKQLIDVSLSEQRLRAFEQGRLVRTFLVSTGIKKMPTPKGVFPIQAKPFKVHYKGPGYDLGIITWNLRFYPSVYIHYAPWNHNFGHVMSHGCVNVDRANAEWIYDWADVGTRVAVHD